MEGSTQEARTSWRDTGGRTSLPRWTCDPVPGVAGCERTLPAAVVTAAHRLAAGLGMPIGTVLLAAHARVLAALSGEDEVVTGYLTDGGPVPCRLSVHPGSWRDLLLRTRRVEAGLLAHPDVPRDEVTSAAGAGYETVLDAGERDGEQDGGPGEDVVLRAGLVRRDGMLVLRLQYRTDVLDVACADRIAGYHLTALEHLVADPDAEHSTTSLLSAGELRLQLEGLAGPRRPLPGVRLHELFEQQVRQSPDAVAAGYGEQRWTYAELDARANRIARCLLAHGLCAEDVVAVVTERDLGWMAAVLGVFKAGGAYLPVEPQLPPRRIAAMLTRAACRLVLFEAGSTGNLDAALASCPGVRAIPLGQAWAESCDATDLGLLIGPGRLAYIYFTSGSTGEPKGAMCEHAGLLNHVLAKIDDLAIGAGTVVAQTAPQCFDISLWQLVSAVLVGGRTVLVPQEVILDVPRFVDTLVAERVAVLQVVPSYLDAILAHLERTPRPLPDLRCVSTTGEPLKPQLARRWFAAMPGIPLVNAYGLTETSDDTNHEILHGPPDGDRVPLGRPVANVRVYVVDEHLSPVPLGAPGEIVFSGVCVGRGYVNDPDRTRRAFAADPYRPGERLYRSGDLGRWRADGKLDFLGRADTQVKIRGFRIEIGEIENTLLRLPGVRDAAVVVADGTGGPRRLVAFHTGGPADPDVLRRRLGESLPAYLVPAAFHRRDRLPLTPNGKLDRAALTRLAAELGDGEADHHAPATHTERRMAAVWARVLGIAEDAIGARDDFFDRGGTSLAAVKLAIALDRAVSPADVTRHPVLADLARLVDARADRRPEPAAPAPDSLTSR